MKFSSRKDSLFTIIIISICLFLFGIVFFEVHNQKIQLTNLWPICIILIVDVLLLWLFFDTKYELNKTTFKYKSGPLKGEIPITNIKEIIKNKTLWVGLKPATARKGLIIKYNKYDEIYISPKTNESFINYIKTLNDSIKITIH